MNIREAILKAADHIERNPALFNFNKIDVPSCGTPGCAVGWIGHFCGVTSGHPISKVMHYSDYFNPVIQMGTGEFYDRMRDLTGGRGSGGWGAWTKDAALCAKGLRLYADKYHPATPDWNAIAHQPLEHA